MRLISHLSLIRCTPLGSANHDDVTLLWSCGLLRN
jgi:hypothetical protein